MDIDKIKTELKTECIGKKIIYFDEIGSTNAEAKEKASESTHGTVIIAESQSAGKGRQGKAWTSPKGVGIWMSIIIKSEININDVSKLPVLVSLAVQKAINETTGLDVGIKWPNDIIVNKKKICGILVESQVEGENVNSVVIGIGVNVNQTREYFENLEFASSLAVEDKDKVSREELICNILFYFEKCYNEFINKRSLNPNEIEKHSVLMNKKVRVLYNQKEFIGEVVGFRDDGSIIIKDSFNKEIIITTGKVSIRGLNSYLD